MNTTLFQWPVRVYYEDTDAGGVVYHASYAAFYERARTEMLRHRGLSQQKLLAQGVAFVVRRLTLDYFAPARLDDWLNIHCELVDIKGVSLLFAQKIIDTDQRILNQADVKIACIDPQSMKPRKIPDFITREFRCD